MTEVFFAGARVKEFRRWWVPEESLLAKMEGLAGKIGLESTCETGSNVGIKVHMGEPGDVHYLRPVFASRMVDILKAIGAEPVIVETAGLGYMPGRTTAQKHLEAARKNGFCEESLGAPIVMTDGEEGIDSKKIGDIDVAKGIAELDAMVVLSHVTGHIQAGFGGALKNIGVGCVAKSGKFRVHYTGTPSIDEAKCDLCGECEAVCPAGAIRGGKIDAKKCVCCNACLDVCGERAVKAKLNSRKVLATRIAENAAAVAEAFGERKIAYFNFLLDVLPHCDCHPHSDVPIVPDLGIVASLDPVAVDRASIDMVNAAFGTKGSEAEDSKALERDKDKFSMINPGTRWQVQLETVEKLGIGRQEYVLKKI